MPPLAKLTNSIDKQTFLSTYTKYFEGRSYQGVLSLLNSRSMPKNFYLFLLKSYQILAHYVGFSIDFSSLYEDTNVDMLSTIGSIDVGSSTMD